MAHKELKYEAEARKALEAPGESYTRIAGARKTPESNVETDASRDRPFPVTSTGLMTIWLYLLSTMGVGTSRLESSAYMLILGLGVVMVIQVMVLSVRWARFLAQFGVGAEPRLLSVLANDARREPAAPSQAESAALCRELGVAVYLIKPIKQAELLDAIRSALGLAPTATADPPQDAVPRAADMPPMLLDHTVTPSPLNPLGAKGVGEAGTNGCPPAIANAVMDALRPLGIQHLDLPYTSDRVWQAIQSATVPSCARGFWAERASADSEAGDASSRLPLRTGLLAAARPRGNLPVGVRARVRRRARVRLHVRVRGAEQRLGAVDRELLGDVDPLAAAVVAPPRIALGVLVREHRALALEHRDGDEVLRGDHLERPLLALELVRQGIGDLRIDFGQRAVEVIGW